MNTGTQRCDNMSNEENIEVVIELCGKFVSIEIKIIPR